MRILGNTLRKITSFVKPQLIYFTHSPSNGEIKVIEQFGHRELVVEGLQQSGYLIASLWEKAIKSMKAHHLSSVKNCLILGLGAGSSVKIVNKYFPDCNITGVELDPTILEIADRFFHIQRLKNLTIVKQDAVLFLQQRSANMRQTNKTYDLILVDLFHGEIIPSFVYSRHFIRLLLTRTSKDGYFLINHLRGKKYDKKKKLLENVLSKECSVVYQVKPLVNTVYLCTSQA